MPEPEYNAGYDWVNVLAQAPSEYHAPDGITVFRKDAFGTWREVAE